ncbi:hypothetical protein DI09_72p80 [Mitosporidium daphniae]|uniref:Uncharacterized protein n=1 Tax=Mitosporidium daphniae TaxID=1485682 RepID=A0A098VNQ2_9MICR|nr:uncharacterized protein DI09_72p80 [Mitosporidium daphniae]KGG50389.1 hypothetical protein DI09_72p80 [Mitosporidium daphniae]|eukprot:XP_013236832.1 uncharacterized protein DI09_72p80 [Mitosporidium daphniae]
MVSKQMALSHTYLLLLLLDPHARLIVGTLTVENNENTYSIPASISLSSTYPFGGDDAVPVVLKVIPTPLMSINLDCPYIFENGVFKYSHPFLCEGEDGNLIIQVISEAIAKFAAIPPVFAIDDSGQREQVAFGKETDLSPVSIEHGLCVAEADEKEENPMPEKEENPMPEKEENPIPEKEENLSFEEISGSSFNSEHRIKGNFYAQLMAEPPDLAAKDMDYRNIPNSSIDEAIRLLSDRIFSREGCIDDLVNASLSFLTRSRSYLFGPKQSSTPPFVPLEIGISLHSSNKI